MRRRTSITRPPFPAEVLDDLELARAFGAAHGYDVIEVLRAVLKHRRRRRGLS